MDLTVASLSVVGGRRHNEDGFVVHQGLGLLAVADGMGGYSGGEIATAVALLQVVRGIEAGQSLRSSLHLAHQAILAASGPRTGHMGATLVAAQIGHDGHYHVSWVGDSRLYAWDGRRFKLMTRDHSYVEQLLMKGEISFADSLHHPRRNVVTQVLGAAKDDNPEVATVSSGLKQGHRLLLCSDGLTDVLSDPDLVKILAKGGGVDEVAQSLVAAAEAAGAKDNITVVLAEFNGKGCEPAGRAVQTTGLNGVTRR